MNTITQIEVLRACLPVYQALIQVPKYRPTSHEQEQLKNFRILYKLGVFDSETALLSEKDLEMVGFLVGYISTEN
jgi:hypothetical protein